MKPFVKCILVAVAAAAVIETGTVDRHSPLVSAIALLASLAGLIALIRPIRWAGLGHRGVSTCVLISAIVVLGEAGVAIQKAQEKELFALEASDPVAYLARLKEIDEDRWLEELQRLDPATYGEVQAARARAAQSAAAAAERKAVPEVQVEDRSDGFHCLSIWDGSHRELKAYTKERMRAPNSFEHIETRITPINAAGTHRVVMEFRAQNGFGGMSTGQAIAAVDNVTCVVSGIAIQ